MQSVGVSGQNSPEKQPVPIKTQYHKSYDCGCYSTPPASKFRTEFGDITDARKIKKKKKSERTRGRNRNIPGISTGFTWQYFALSRTNPPPHNENETFLVFVFVIRC